MSVGSHGNVVSSTICYENNGYGYKDDYVWYLYFDRLRVEYAQKLLREHSGMVLDDVADESGFSSRTTFFRSFKALTGMTPQEWKKADAGPGVIPREEMK